MDFTLTKLTQLLKSLQRSDYKFISFSDYIKNAGERVVILRHDIDALPKIALRIAKIESKLNIRGSYYFRLVKESFSPEIMKQIEELNHEIGYHYEDVNLVDKESKRNYKNEMPLDELVDQSYKNFVKNLNIFRSMFKIETICMHGSPMAKLDNKLIWDKYNYKNLNLIGEPYYDIDYNKFAYLTDTGRRWDGEKFIIRDKVDSPFHFNFRSTNEIIENIDKLPDKILITIHPQRWHNFGFLWLKELVLQNSKNIVKYLILKIR